MALAKISKSLVVNLDYVITVEVINDVVEISLSEGGRDWMYKIKYSELHTGFKNSYGL